MRLAIAYSKIKKRNLVLINNDTHQRETSSERPIRPPLSSSILILVYCFLFFFPNTTLNYVSIRNHVSKMAVRYAHKSPYRVVKICVHPFLFIFFITGGRGRIRRKCQMCTCPVLCFKPSCEVPRC